VCVCVCVLATNHRCDLVNISTEVQRQKGKQEKNQSKEEKKSVSRACRCMETTSDTDEHEGRFPSGYAKAREKRGGVQCALTEACLLPRTCSLWSTSCGHSTGAAPSPRCSSPCCAPCMCTCTCMCKYVCMYTYVCVCVCFACAFVRACAS
jgi:hypothetical protein